MDIYPTRMNKYFRMSYINTLKQSYRSLYLNGVRSNERIKHIHYWVKERFREKLGNKYNYHSYDPNDNTKKELKINGSFYNKSCDIAISDKKNNPIAAISVKFITSNFKQNGNNYFEAMLGESYNIKKENILYAHLIICPNPIPYYFKGGKFKCLEYLSDKDIDKYIRLNKSSDIFSPDFTSLNIINLNTENYINPLKFKTMDLDKQIEYLNNLTNGIDISNNNNFNINTQRFLSNTNIEQMINNICNKIST